MINIKYILVCWLSTCIFSVQGIAQTSFMKANVVILVDDKLETGALTNIRIKVKNGDQEVNHTVDYVPGELQFSKETMEAISDESSQSYLQFDYNILRKNSHRICNYEIEIFESWFKHRYLIFRFYNMKKKKFRKLYEPLEGRDYSFVLEYPGGATVRMKK